MPPKYKRIGWTNFAKDRKRLTRHKKENPNPGARQAAVDADATDRAARPANATSDGPKRL